MVARTLISLVLALTTVPVASVHAQNSLAPAVEPERWQELSPDSRREMRREYLKNLSAGERRKLRSQVKRFNSMSTTKQQELCARFRKDRGYLPPACQDLF